MKGEPLYVWNFEWKYRKKEWKCPDMKNSLNIIYGWHKPSWRFVLN